MAKTGSVLLAINNPHMHVRDRPIATVRGVVYLWSGYFFIPVGFLKNQPAVRTGCVFNQLLAVLLSLLFAGMYELQDKGLQEKSGLNQKSVYS